MSRVVTQEKGEGAGFCARWRKPSENAPVLSVRDDCSAAVHAGVVSSHTTTHTNTIKPQRGPKSRGKVLVSSFDPIADVGFPIAVVARTPCI